MGNKNWFFTTDSLRNTCLKNVAGQKIVPLIAPDFVLIRYGKVTDTETSAFERRVYYLQFPREEGMQGLMGRYLVRRQKEQGKSMTQSPSCGLLEKEWERQCVHLGGNLGLESLNNFRQVLGYRRGAVLVVQLAGP